MDHEHIATGRQYDQLKQVAGAVDTGHEEARWIIVEFDPCQRMVVGMRDVVVGNFVPAGRGMDVRTQLAYYVKLDRS